MSAPWRNVAVSLERLSTDMLVADSGPHLAIVLGIEAGKPPHMWFADSSPHPIADPAERLRFGVEPQSKGRTTPFAVSELEAAHQWLGDYLSAIRMFRYKKVQPVDAANEMFAHRQAAEIERIMDAGFYEMEHPYQCDGCRRRFKTQGPLTRHRKTCINGTNGHSWASSFSSDSGRTGIRCTCGEHAWGDTHEEAARAMRAHIDACNGVQ